jgi:hypothetical protein
VSSEKIAERWKVVLDSGDRDWTTTSTMYIVTTICGLGTAGADPGSNRRDHCHRWQVYPAALSRTSRLTFLCMIALVAVNVIQQGLTRTKEMGAVSNSATFKYYQPLFVHVGVSPRRQLVCSDCRRSIQKQIRAIAQRHHASSAGPAFVLNGRSFSGNSSVNTSRQYHNLSKVWRLRN